MPDRRFLGWDEPLLPQATSALLEDFSEGSRLDLGEALLVVPGARAGRRLLELLVDHSSGAGVRLTPPHRILTVGSLPEELYRPPKTLAPSALSRRAWAGALESAPSSVVQEALGPHAIGLNTAAKVGFARLLDSLSRTVASAGRDFGDVARECRKGFLFSDEERWTALGQLQTEMRSSLAKAGYWEKGKARSWALEANRIESHRMVFLIGIAELPLITRRMLQKVDKMVLAFVQAPPSASNLFDDLGTVRTDAWQDHSIPIRDESLVVRENPVDQAREVAQALELLEKDHSADEVTIGVPDPSVVPYLAQKLEEKGYRTRYAEGTPLSLSPPVQLLKAVADYSGSERFSALANLLRHPDLPGSLFPDRAPDIADEYFRGHLPELMGPGRVLAGRAGEQLSEVLSAIHGPEFLGSLEGEATLSEWMPRILDLLLATYGDEGRFKDPAHRRLILEACLQIRSAAEALSQLPRSLDPPCHGPDALRILLGELKDGRVPPGSDEAAVELVGWLELQLDDAQVIILTGVSDPFLPETVNADPFLPNALRNRLGIEDNRSRYARDAYRLTALVNSVSSTVLIAGRRTASGDPLRPSRLLLTGTDKELAQRILTLTGSAQTGLHRSRAGDDTGAVEIRKQSAFRLPPEPEIQVPELPEPLPVTAFRSLMSDPYLWILQRKYRLDETERESQELDPRSFGTFAHSVLERFARTAEATSTDSEAIQKRLQAILAGLFEETFGTNTLPTVPLQIEQLRTRLEAFATWQAGWVAKGWNIVCSEARTPPEGVPLDVDGVPVRLSGRIDRIDRHRETGAWMLFDYKSGDGGVDLKSVRGRDGVWKDLQLPLYRRLLDDLYRPDETRLPQPGPDEAVGMAYLPIPKTPGPIQPVEGLWTEEDLHSAEETARDVIRAFRERGRVVFDPNRVGSHIRGDLATLLGRGLLQTDGGATGD
jgi:ATP-dependent helicase/nuclease subunit B